MINFSDTGCAKDVFHWFLGISKIPRGSYNTAPIADFLSEFAKSRGLEYIRDGFDNVIIKKPAARGFEDRPTVILQGHSDIVAEKTAESEKDLLNEGLDVYRDGDFLRAVGTTLGGDDGVALAYALALLDDPEAKHPALEAVFTTNEETGLEGASGINPDNLSGRIMINIDSDVEGVFTVGCAGGLRMDLSLPVKREAVDAVSYTVTVSGLRGGHSGVDIDKGRLNATKVLREALELLGASAISEIRGGTKDNAIPRSALAHVCFDKEPDTELLRGLCKKYSEAEPSINISLKKEESSLLPLDFESTKRVLKAIDALPFGVVKMSEDIPGLPETSMNIGLVTTESDTVNIACSLRSSKASEKLNLAQKVRSIAKAAGATVKEHGEYPGWEYKKDSRVREVMCDVYRKMYGKEATVLTIHAGLECGLFSDKLKGLDCISIGPDNFDIHTTEEHLSISSTVRVFEFLCEVLKNI